jgi:CRISPR-associated protein Cas1
MVSSPETRLEVARQMYAMRFGGEDLAGLSIQQLRGREGRRVRDIYRDNAKTRGIRWDGRRYDPNDFSSSDPVNMALSSATTALYGLCQGVIVSLGCAPGLGFIHSGSDRAFVYDIADLYKAELAIPIAFAAAQEEPGDPSGATRRRMRDAFFESRLLERVSRDVVRLLRQEDLSEELGDVLVGLWGPEGEVAGGRNFGE